MILSFVEFYKEIKAGKVGKREWAVFALFTLIGFVSVVYFDFDLTQFL